MQHLPFAYGEPSATAVFKTQPEDFLVDELLPFEPDGEGEHFLIHLRKRELNTDEVAQKLARFAGVKSFAVSYAGKKDRQGITSQWFSVQVPGKRELDFSQLNEANITVLKQSRHSKKLRRGALAGNRFTIILRQLSGDVRILEQRLQSIINYGFPNYFGEQRFGRDYQNLKRAQKWFAGEYRPKGRNLRGILLSAARSQIFNNLLSARIEQGWFDRLQPGDVLQLSGSRSFFVAQDINDELMERYETGDVQITGPMWGEGEPPSEGKVCELEMRIAESTPDLIQGLTDARMKQERRVLSIRPTDTQWRVEESVLHLSFTLPPGCYATALLRELLNYQTADAEKSQ